ncbi:MAG: YchJ family metal-binding protein [bacterium]
MSRQTTATTAEALMRSRYTAFCLGDRQYLLKSWHPDTRPSRVAINPDQQWLDLKILNTTAGRSSDETGKVEFRARYKLAGRGYRLHETSRFIKIASDWYYLDGVHHGS